MKLALFATLLAFSDLGSSAPLPGAELETRATTYIYPNLAVNIFTPDHGTIQGAVYAFRYTAVGIQHETNTLIAFPFPNGQAGKTCSFAFSNGSAPPQSSNPNSQRVQLFSVGGPILPTNTYTSRPYRNVSYGGFHISNDGVSAVWDGPIPTFPCPAAATTLGFEVVPVSDFDDVSWPIGAGLALVIL